MMGEEEEGGEEGGEGDGVLGVAQGGSSSNSPKRRRGAPEVARGIVRFAGEM